MKKLSDLTDALIGPVLEMPRRVKRAIALTIDAVISILTVWMAFYLRLGEWTYLSGNQWLAVIAALVIALPLFIISGLYRAIFRYAGWPALMAVARACLLYGFAYSAIFTFLGVAGVPRTVGLIQPVLLFVVVGASRAFARYWLSGAYIALLNAGARKRVLIYGAGSSGRHLAEAISYSRDMAVVGYLDDDSRLHGSMLGGRRIYPLHAVRSLARDEGVTDVLLAMPSATRQRRKEIFEALRAESLNVRTLPALMDLAHGRLNVSALRELDIDDLLGRSEVVADPDLLRHNIVGKVVMITGAGGSIGSELCRQVLSWRPSVILLIDINEYALYAINHELCERRSSAGLDLIRIVPLLASVRDVERMDSIFATWRIDTVYHAAAYKHVPLVEHNPIEGIRNNVFGTMVTARIARKHGVSDFVLISTDKAVRPTNVMGTSKRMAELVLQALAADSSQTRFSMVRFGNVLGSSGSVVPLFRRQIRDGGPITITHREITRFFMTIPEAAQLVIQAGAMADGGEVFILSMGEPVRILDLAYKMVELSGLTVRSIDNPHGDIEIVEIGLRPGEKLYEELLIGNNPQPTDHPHIMKATETMMPLPVLMRHLDELAIAMDRRDVVGVQGMLRDLVPEYQPKDEPVDWLLLERG